MAAVASDLCVLLLVAPLVLASAKARVASDLWSRGLESAMPPALLLLVALLVLASAAALVASDLCSLRLESARLPAVLRLVALVLASALTAVASDMLLLVALLLVWASAVALWARSLACLSCRSHPLARPLDHPPTSLQSSADAAWQQIVAQIALPKRSSYINVSY